MLSRYGLSYIIAIKYEQRLQNKCFTVNSVQTGVVVCLTETYFYFYVSLSPVKILILKNRMAACCEFVSIRKL